MSERGSRGRSGPTIFDVARRADVSHQTVSRLINGDPTVRAHLRERIEAAIAELGYRPRAAARALAGRDNRALGLVTTGGALWGPSSTALGFNRAARAAGYHVLAASLDLEHRSSSLPGGSVRPGGPSPVRESGAVAEMRDAIETLLAQDVGAIVLVAADSTAIDALDRVADQVPVPIVIANGVPGRAHAGTAVAIDQAAGARLAVRALLDAGRNRIVHISGPAVSQEAALRRDAYVELIRAAGLPAVVLEGDWTAEAGYRLGSGIDGAAVDGVFCGNDQMALGVLHALHDRGIAVPGDIAVVGFDDIPEAAHFIPPLTTVRQDFAALGERVLAAVDSVLSRGAAPESAESESLAVDVAPLVPILVQRDSTPG
ncbi:LacI family DNA-binding transcriptional regulator [Curtobacterium ammoniigenes]|uniref:LacI family DNA-binding transcriptional regulator n=1 Tax=Curtobacterium ammoniigenes TaxID=395387 RepID=UPI0009FAE476|nr:substrate-binding domain-containing protein [Curtobacterium ammoniigenes]